MWSSDYTSRNGKYISGGSIRGRRERLQPSRRLALIVRIDDVAVNSNSSLREISHKPLHERHQRLRKCSSFKQGSVELTNLQFLFQRFACVGKSLEAFVNSPYKQAEYDRYKNATDAREPERMINMAMNISDKTLREKSLRQLLKTLGSTKEEASKRLETSSLQPAIKLHLKHLLESDR